MGHQIRFVSVKTTIDDWKDKANDEGRSHIIPQHDEDTKKIISELKKYRLDPWEPSRTITSATANKLVHYEKDRFLTARECAQLQSFPDDFLFEGSQTKVYKQIGNAVPPLFAECIAKTVKGMLEKIKEEESADGNSDDNSADGNSEEESADGNSADETPESGNDNADNDKQIREISIEAKKEIKLNYFTRMGGKSKLRKDIVSSFPPIDKYDVFVEPFIGSGQVMLEILPKIYQTKKVVINDKNKDIYHMWEDLRSIKTNEVKTFDWEGKKEL